MKQRVEREARIDSVLFLRRLVRERPSDKMMFEQRYIDVREEQVPRPSEGRQ